MHWYMLLASALSSVAIADTERVNIKVNILSAPVLPAVTKSLPESFHLQSKSLLGKWDFQIQKFETSCKDFSLWKKKLNASGLKNEETSALYECSLSPEQPVTSISWHTAASYCRDQKARLPTETEWVVAAVISTGVKQACFDQVEAGTWVSSSDKLKDDKQAFLNCVFKVSDDEMFEELGLDIIEEQKNDVEMTWPGINGVYGMEGNVWEWTSSSWRPQGVADKQAMYRVIKGGAFSNGQNSFINNPQWRNAVPQDTNNYSNIGFRCVWDNGEAVND